jgi:hypothetical protein
MKKIGGESRQMPKIREDIQTENQVRSQVKEAYKLGDRRPRRHRHIESNVISYASLTRHGPHRKRRK